MALDVEDLAFDLLVTIRASKTDQEQAGAQVAVPFARAGNDLARSARCAPTSRRAGIHRGPVFRGLRRGDTP